jgi:hypothetical protein
MRLAPFAAPPCPSPSARYAPLIITHFPPLFRHYFRFSSLSILPHFLFADAISAFDADCCYAMPPALLMPIFDAIYAVDAAMPIDAAAITLLLMIRRRYACR